MVLIVCRVVAYIVLNLMVQETQYTICSFEPNENTRSLKDLSLFTSLHLFISYDEQFSFIMRKISFPVHGVDCSCRFRLIASVTIGAILELVTLRSPSLSFSLCRSDRSCCWMEEWPLSVWVSPRGQLGEIIRQDSYRRAGRCSRLKLFLPDSEAYFEEFVLWVFSWTFLSLDFALFCDILSFYSA